MSYHVIDCASSDEDEYEVEKIVSKFIDETGAPHYLVKWKGYGEEDSSWEPEKNLDCKDLIREYEENVLNEREKSERTRKLNAKGFERGLKIESIIGATKWSGRLIFLIKWRDCEETDLVAASEANVKAPQDVIEFYEKRFLWLDNYK